MPLAQNNSYAKAACVGGKGIFCCTSRAKAKAIERIRLETYSRRGRNSPRNRKKKKEDREKQEEKPVLV